MKPFVSAFFFGLLLVFSFGALAENNVTLKVDSEVDHPAIRLSDVFDGVPREIDRDIATAPEPGKHVVYDVIVLNKLAQKYRLSWQPQSLADRSVLTRASNKITQEMIHEAVLKKLQSENIRGRVDVLFDRKSMQVDLPTDRAPVFVLNNFDYDPSDKRFRTTLVADAGFENVTLPVTGRVTVEREVPVLAKRLASGSLISKGDLDWVSYPDTRITPDLVTEADQLVGMAVRHDMPEGEPVRAQELMPPRAVRRGNIVTMKVETPLLLVTAQGRVLQDGAVGDVVRITNTQSNRTVEGVVEAPGVVRIKIAQQGASVQASAQ